MASIHYTTPVSQQYGPVALNTCHKVIKFLQEGPKNSQSTSQHVPTPGDIQTITMIQTFITQLQKPTCSIDVIARAFYNLGLTFNNKGQMKEAASLSKSALKLYTDHTTDHQRSFLSAQLYIRSAVQTYQTRLNQFQDAFQHHISHPQSTQSTPLSKNPSYLYQQQPDVILRTLLDVFWTIFNALKVFLKLLPAVSLTSSSQTSSQTTPMQFYQVKLYVHWIMGELISVILRIFEVVKELASLSYFQPSIISPHFLSSTYLSTIASLNNDEFIESTYKHPLDDTPYNSLFSNPSIPQCTLPLSPFHIAHNISQSIDTQYIMQLPQVVVHSLHFQLITALITFSTHLITYNPASASFLHLTIPYLFTSIHQATNLNRNQDSSSILQKKTQQLYNTIMQLSGSQLTSLIFLLILSHYLELFNDPLIIHLQYHSQYAASTSIKECCVSFQADDKTLPETDLFQSDKILPQTTPNNNNSNYLANPLYFNTYSSHPLLFPQLCVSPVDTADPIATMLYSSENIIISTTLLTTSFNTLVITLIPYLNKLPLNHISTLSIRELNTLMTISYLYFIAITTPLADTPIADIIYNFITTHTATTLTTNTADSLFSPQSSAVLSQTTTNTVSTKAPPKNRSAKLAQNISQIDPEDSISSSSSLTSPHTSSSTFLSNLSNSITPSQYSAILYQMSQPMLLTHILEIVTETHHNSTNISSFPALQSLQSLKLHTKQHNSKCPNYHYFPLELTTYHHYYTNFIPLLLNLSNITSLTPNQHQHHNSRSLLLFAYKFLKLVLTNNAILSPPLPLLSSSSSLSSSSFLPHPHPHSVSAMSTTYFPISHLINYLSASTSPNISSPSSYSPSHSTSTPIPQTTLPSQIHQFAHIPTPTNAAPPDFVVSPLILAATHIFTFIHTYPLQPFTELIKLSQIDPIVSPIMVSLSLQQDQYQEHENSLSNHSHDSSQPFSINQSHKSHEMQCQLTTQRLNQLLSQQPSSTSSSSSPSLHNPIQWLPWLWVQQFATTTINLASTQSVNQISSESSTPISITSIPSKSQLISPITSNTVEYPPALPLIEDPPQTVVKPRGRPKKTPTATTPPIESTSTLIAPPSCASPDLSPYLSSSIASSPIPHLCLGSILESELSYAFSLSTELMLIAQGLSITPSTTSATSTSQPTSTPLSSPKLTPFQKFLSFSFKFLLNQTLTVLLSRQIFQFLSVHPVYLSTALLTLATAHRSTTHHCDNIQIPYTSHIRLPHPYCHQISYNPILTAAKEIIAEITHFLTSIQIEKTLYTFNRDSFSPLTLSKCSEKDQKVAKELVDVTFASTAMCTINDDANHHSWLSSADILCSTTPLYPSLPLHTLHNPFLSPSSSTTHTHIELPSPPAHPLLHPRRPQQIQNQSHNSPNTLDSTRAQIYLIPSRSHPIFGPINPFSSTSSPYLLEYSLYPHHFDPAFVNHALLPYQHLSLAQKQSLGASTTTSVDPTPSSSTQLISSNLPPPTLFPLDTITTSFGYAITLKMYDSGQFAPKMTPFLNPSTASSSQSPVDQLHQQKNFIINPNFNPMVFDHYFHSVISSTMILLGATYRLISTVYLNGNELPKGLGYLSHSLLLTRRTLALTDYFSTLLLIFELVISQYQIPTKIDDHDVNITGITPTVLDSNTELLYSTLFRTFITFCTIYAVPVDLHYISSSVQINNIDTFHTNSGLENDELNEKHQNDESNATNRAIYMKFKLTAQLLQILLLLSTLFASPHSHLASCWLNNDRTDHTVRSETSTNVIHTLSTPHTTNTSMQSPCSSKFTTLDFHFRYLTTLACLILLQKISPIFDFSMPFILPSLSSCSITRTTKTVKKSTKNVNISNSPPHGTSVPFNELSNVLHNFDICAFASYFIGFNVSNMNFQQKETPNRANLLYNQTDLQNIPHRHAEIESLFSLSSFFDQFVSLTSSLSVHGEYIANLTVKKISSKKVTSSTIPTTQPNNSPSPSTAAQLLSSLIGYLNNPSKSMYTQLTRRMALSTLNGGAANFESSYSLTQVDSKTVTMYDNSSIAQLSKALLFSTLTKFTQQLTLSFLLSSSSSSLSTTPNALSSSQSVSTPTSTSVTSATQFFTTILHMLSLNQSFRIQKDLYLDETASPNSFNFSNSTHFKNSPKSNDPNAQQKSTVSFGAHFLSDLAQLLGLNLIESTNQNEFTLSRFEQFGKEKNETKKDNDQDDQNQNSDDKHTSFVLSDEIFSQILSKISLNASYDNISGPQPDMAPNANAAATSHTDFGSLFNVLPSWLQILAISTQNTQSNNTSLCISVISPLTQIFNENIQKNLSPSTKQPSSRTFSTFLLPLLSLPSTTTVAVSSPTTMPSSTVSIWDKLQYQWYYLHHINTLHNANTKYLSSSSPTASILTPLQAAKLWWSHAYRIEYAMLSYLIHVERMFLGPLSGVFRPPLSCSHAASITTHYSHNFLNKFTQMFSNTNTLLLSQNTLPQIVQKKRVANKKTITHNTSLEIENPPPVIPPTLYSTEQSQLLAALLNSLLFSPLYKNTGGLSFSYRTPFQILQIESPSTGFTLTSSSKPSKSTTKSSKSSPQSPNDNQHKDKINEFIHPQQQQQQDAYQPLPGPYSPLSTILYIVGFISTPFVTLRHITSLLRFLHIKQSDMIDNDINCDFISALYSCLTDNSQINSKKQQGHSILPLNPYSTDYFFAHILEQVQGHKPGDSALDSDWIEYLHYQKQEINFLSTFTSSSRSSNASQLLPSKSLANSSRTIINNVYNLNNPYCYDFISSNRILGSPLSNSSFDHITINSPDDIIENDDVVMNDEQFMQFLSNSISLDIIPEETINSAVNNTINMLHKDFSSSHHHNTPRDTDTEHNTICNDIPTLFDPFATLSSSCTIHSPLLIDRLYICFVQFYIFIQTIQKIYLSPELTCSMNSNFATRPLSLLVSKDLMNFPWESLPIMRWCDFTIPINSPYVSTTDANGHATIESQTVTDEETVAGVVLSTQDLHSTVYSLRLPIEDTAVDLFHLAMHQREQLEQKFIVAKEKSIKPKPKPKATKKATKTGQSGDNESAIHHDSDNEAHVDDYDDNTNDGDNETIFSNVKTIDTSPTASSHLRFRSRCVIKPQRMTRILSLHHLYLTHCNLYEKQQNELNGNGGSGSGSNDSSTVAPSFSSMAQSTPIEWDTMYQSLGLVCDPRQTVFQLDPSNDLPKTQQKFKYFFKDVLRLKGEVGKPFNITTLHKAFEYCHMYIYAGHNNGQQFYKYNDIAKLCSKIGSKIVSIVWLLGCSSAKFEQPSLNQYLPSLPPLNFLTTTSTTSNSNRPVISKSSSSSSQTSMAPTDPDFNLESISASSSLLSSSQALPESSDSSTAQQLRRTNHHNEIITHQRIQIVSSFVLPTTLNVFEPHGSVLGYILAGVPCVIGNLWNVTDQDIDKQTKIFCEQIFQQRYQLPPPSSASSASSTSSFSQQQQIFSSNLPLCGSVLSKIDICTHNHNMIADNVTSPLKSKYKFATKTSNIHSCDISSLLFSSRQACLLPYVNGSALVVYGAHVRTDKPIKTSSSTPATSSIIAASSSSNSSSRASANRK